MIERMLPYRGSDHAWSTLFPTALQPRKPLPIFSPKDVNPELVDSSLHNRGIGIQGGYHKIRSFNLLDQLGRSVDETLLKDKIVVADFFFVSCGSICPIMTKNLEKVHQF